MNYIDENELAEVLDLVGKRSNARIRTTLPARISSFDKDTQTATVVLAVQSYRWDVDLEEPVAYQPEPIARCPVYFPTGGGYTLRFPLEKGDDCLVLVAERSIDEWAATGEATNIPRDLRRFDLSDAIVLPGLHPTARAVADFDDDKLRLGKEDASGMVEIDDNGDVVVTGSSSVKLGSSSASQAVLKGDAWMSEFLTAFNAHTHPDPSSGTTGTPSTPLTEATNFPNSKSTKVKTE